MQTGTVVHPDEQPKSEPKSHAQGMKSKNPTMVRMVATMRLRIEMEMNAPTAAGASHIAINAGVIHQNISQRCSKVTSSGAVKKKKNTKLTSTGKYKSIAGSMRLHQILPVDAPSSFNERLVLFLRALLTIAFYGFPFTLPSIFG
jgi:hypothetical protein